MPHLAHKLYIASMVSIVLFITVFLIYKGVPYYSTSLEERFYHSDHELFKPSGLFGHGLGIIGTLLILFGVFSYIARKRYAFLSRWGRLKYWLEFHIFLCVLGPIMILFHTAFKFGGIVSISFWSMVAVVASGVIGRFIYIQIPRSIEGNELSLSELKEMQSNLELAIKDRFQLDSENFNTIRQYLAIEPSAGNKNLLTGSVTKYFQDLRRLKAIRRSLRGQQVPKVNYQPIIKLVKNEMALSNKIERLQSMHELFRYWHIAHLPFAAIMLLIMIIHVGITVAFGARWIF